MSDPKNHHFISKFLLRKFASRDGQRLVHRLDGGRVFKTQPANVGSETHGYRVSEDFAEDPVVYERHMSSLEAEASVAIQDLQESGEVTVPSHLREVLVRFFVLHAFRHRELRDRMTLST